MPNNALTAINRIVKFGNNDLKRYATNEFGRINTIDKQVESYIKDAIAGSFKLSRKQKPTHYAKIFSYFGNQNNPPNIIIKNGDAFEINRIDRPFASLAQNISPPKDVLSVSDKRVTKACRNCESKPWKQKDLFYIIGNAKKGIINYLLFVQGTCYITSHDAYDKIKRELKKIYKGDSFDFNSKGDRIKNPLAYFRKYLKYNPNKFSIYAIIETQKYLSFSKKDRIELEKLYLFS